MQKRILITGSTDGIGKQIALDLAALGHEVIIHGRDKQKVEKTSKEISNKIENGLIAGLVADFSSLKQVREMSEEIFGSYDYIDVLINNAGVYMNNNALSEDGFEMTFAINHLATFELTLQLLQLIKRSSQGRIITVASAAHESSPPLDFENLAKRKSYNAYDAYAQSKLCNILLTYELHEKLQNSPVTANCLHPGVISTKLLHEAFSIQGNPLIDGAGTPVYLANSQEVSNVSGKYFINEQIRKSSLLSYDFNTRIKLWKLSEELTGTSN